MISVFDLFSIGIGPSSSHTVGPMRAAAMFARSLAGGGALGEGAGIRAELFGSLGAPGHGHGSVPAVVLGLSGQEPETVDPAAAAPLVDAVRASGILPLPGTAGISFAVDDDIILHRRQRLPFHPNAIRFTALDAAGGEVSTRTYYSIGGGFVLGEDEAGAPAIVADATPVPYPFSTGAELLAQCTATGRRIWAVMQECVARGCAAGGVLPGGLKVRRRAQGMRETLERAGAAADPLQAMEWITAWALAVNEENAAGGRVVTAPTNGTAGIIPAVLHYYAKFVPGADDDGVVRFLLTAA